MNLRRTPVLGAGALALAWLAPADAQRSASADPVPVQLIQNWLDQKDFMGTGLHGRSRLEKIHGFHPP